MEEICNTFKEKEIQKSNINFTAQDLDEVKVKDQLNETTENENRYRKSDDLLLVTDVTASEDITEPLSVVMNNKDCVKKDVPCVNCPRTRKKCAEFEIENNGIKNNNFSDKCNESFTENNQSDLKVPSGLAAKRKVPGKRKQVKHKKIIQFNNEELIRENSNNCGKDVGLTTGNKDLESESNKYANQKLNFTRKDTKSIESKQVQEMDSVTEIAKNDSENEHQNSAVKKIDKNMEDLESESNKYVKQKLNFTRKYTKSTGSKKIQEMDSVTKIAENGSEKERQNSAVKKIDKNIEDGREILKTNEDCNDKSVLENDTSTFNFFDITIPLVGKNVISDNNEKPLTSRYDLAVRMNKARSCHQIEEGIEMPDISYEEWREKQKNKSEEEKTAEAARELNYNLSVARYVTKLTIKILMHLQNDIPDEKCIGKLFILFSKCPVTPKSLLYVPYFVHAMMFCRGYKEFSRQLRSLADECYQKCHCMFPVPIGCNFETVYMSEVRKFLPDALERFDDLSFDYDDFSDNSDSECD